MTEPFAVEMRGEVLVGPVRRPHNAFQSAKGSIHDDVTASKLGFRGGTVAGNVHFEQFAPLMEALFGVEWHRTGGLSLYFLHATTDGEPVQAFARPQASESPGIRRAEVWMEGDGGVRICEGTAAVGGDDPNSALKQRLKTVRPATGLRMLADRHVGDEVKAVPARLKRSETDPRLAAITEPLAAYADASIFGEMVAAPSVAIDALRVVEQPMFKPRGPYVGMFGAIELQFLDGPVFVDHDYLADGRVLALSESPKTEMTWYESTLRDTSDGRAVARLILLSRLLKGSSPLWS